MNETVRAWVTGWVVSRGAAEPLAEPWGRTVDVGLPEQVTRHVLGTIGDAVDEETVRKVAGSVLGRGVWLKVFADPARVAPWLGDGWWIDPEPAYLMSARLTGRPDAGRPLPDGYRSRSWTRDGVTRVLITAADGSFAARGQIATVGTIAVVDQIETSAGHRRLGLGSAVMRTLHRTAAERGAHTGVLGGTPDGRALYESLGWRVVAPLTSAKYTGGSGDSPADTGDAGAAA
ncbi:GNAT family N-acetyltransferase [Streptomyces sp. NPDC004610]|uniref:GNAT family N-acetyltransferase n=1 Tax=unclassified Streptomyces TaxID=2593676 RepID=UPI0033BD6EDF